MVEVTGLEPTTSWSRTKRATKLRYTSILYWSSNRSFHDPLVPRRRTPLSANVFPAEKRSAVRRRLLFPKISLAPLAAIFGSPVPCALPNCATPRYNLFQKGFGRSATSWSLVAARLFPPTFSLRKNVRLFGGASSSQKSRSRRSLRFSGALCRAHYQTALHLDFILVFQQVVPRPLGPSSSALPEKQR